MRMRLATLRSMAFAIALFLPPAVLACDLCGCYTPQLEAAAPQHEMREWYAAVSEQFTYFGTVQVDDREVPNPADQYLASSITQLVAGYSFASRFAVQFNAPLIYRQFRRPEGFTIDEGTESGLGDVSLLGRAVLFHYTSPGEREFRFEGKNPIAIQHEPEFSASLVGLIGVKFPTGATSRLKEEFHETETPGAPESGIHGHDLTLGTGSYDGICGCQATMRCHNCFAEANGQFTLRGDGAHQYHFANDFTWSAGPGYYVIRRPDTIVGCQCVASGESKDVDRFRGKPAVDTGVTSVFVGPRIVAGHGILSGEVAAEFPVLMNTTALQVVPDYRLHASFAFSW